MDHKERSYYRILSLFGIIFILLVIAAIRLFQIQIINHRKYDELAAKQYGSSFQSNQSRRVLYDRNGKILRGPAVK